MLKFYWKGGRRSSVSSNANCYYKMGIDVGGYSSFFIYLCQFIFYTPTTDKCQISSAKNRAGLPEGMKIRYSVR